MNKLSIVTAVATLFALQAPAHAALITISPAGQLTNGGSVATFEGLTQTPYGQTTAAGPFSDGGASFSGTGLIMKNPGQDSLGFYAEPFHDTTNYLAVLGGRSETITYSGPRHSFGLYWGSIDTWNTIAFYTNVGDANPFVTYTGGQIAPLIADGNQANDNSNRYVTFSDLAFSKVVLSSSQNSFEVDNIAAGVPELSTWMMMLVGFAGIGFMAFRRANRIAETATSIGGA
jgi:hypothetical protein